MANADQMWGGGVRRRARRPMIAKAGRASDALHPYARVGLAFTFPPVALP
jgi:hypothetical protein